MIRKSINKVKRIIDQQQWKSATTDIAAIPYQNDVETKRFLVVLTFLQSSHWNSDELAQFKLIEELRNFYSTSKKTINVLDYGAGDPESNPTVEEMKLGVSTMEKVSDIFHQAATSTKLGELIFKIIRDFKPINCLELGTSLGISAAYQIAALQLNGLGKFTSIEGSKEIAELATNSLSIFDYPNFKIHVGRFIDVLPEILSVDNPIDFVFIDGHHDKKATLDYYEMIFPFLSEKAIVIFDDINWSAGMKQAWGSIYKEGKGVKIGFDLYYWGICLIDKNADPIERDCYKIKY